MRSGEPEGPGPEMMAPSVLIRDLHHSYGDIPVLKGINLQVMQGSFIALMGESGSGKSTLLNCIGGMDRPVSGSLEVGGRQIVGLSLKQLADFRRSSIAFIFQDFNLVPTLTVRENVELPVRLRREKFERRNVDALLDRVGMLPRAGNRPDQLSGGEMQRCAIARALVLSPVVLLADEPTGSLDLRNADRIMDLLREIQQEQRLTIVMATHSHRLAAQAGRIVTMEDGILVESEDGP